MTHSEANLSTCVQCGTEFSDRPWTVRGMGAQGDSVVVTPLCSRKCVEVACVENDAWEAVK